MPLHFQQNFRSSSEQFSFVSLPQIIKTLSTRFVKIIVSLSNILSSLTFCFPYHFHHFAHTSITKKPQNFTFPLKNKTFRIQGSYFCHFGQKFFGKDIDFCWQKRYYIRELFNNRIIIYKKWQKYLII